MAAVLIVDQGVIRDVGLAANVSIPEGATVVDLTGKTVMPALVDLHGHLGFIDDLSFDNANYTHENILDQLNRYAYYGVGTIVSLGTDPGTLAFEIQAEQEAGMLGRRSAPHGVPGHRPPRRWSWRGSDASDRLRRLDSRGGAGTGRRHRGHEGRVRQDLGRRPGWRGRQADAGPVWTTHRRGARTRPAGDRARLLRRGCTRAGGCRGRRFRPPGPRHGDGR